MQETPTIASSSYASSTADVASLMAQAAPHVHRAIRRVELGAQPTAAMLAAFQQKEPDTMAVAVSTRRLVQVFICDPDENVPLDKAMLYSGEQKLTDLTNQELYFEIDIRSALEKHNEVRKTLVDKTVKDRTVQLEPARVRDLKMTVVEIATF